MPRSSQATPQSAPDSQPVSQPPAAVPDVSLGSSREAAYDLCRKLNMRCGCSERGQPPCPSLEASLDHFSGDVAAAEADERRVIDVR